MSTTVKHSSSSGDTLNLLLLLLIATITRIYALGHPNQVVFDEVHFGMYASQYIKGTFFFDVHPPLAKLLLALFGWFVGYDGSFSFDKIGQEYDGSWYVAMRFASALAGILLVPTVYLLLKAWKFSGLTSVLGASLVLLDNAVVGQSRLALLDSFYMLFIMGALLSWSKVVNYEGNYSPLAWMVSTGVFVGATLSTKLTGYILLVFIGLCAIKNLWNMIDDLSIDLSKFVYHLMVRILSLLVLPLTIYLACFHLHFSLVTTHTKDANRFSMEFQTMLKGNPVQVTTPQDIAYGSKIALRHVHTFRGYLHSHSHAYPTGSKQQQVTGYPINDDNSKWIILKQEGNITGMEYIKNKAIVRLEHVITKKKLHSHDVAPAVSDKEKHKEVSAYGMENFEGDSNDYWIVDIYDHNPAVPESKDRLMAIHSVFRLVHVNHKCQLFAFTNQLPAWGFSQQEITCMQNAIPKHALWRIDSNQHEGLAVNAPTASYRPLGFLERFWELYSHMVKSNNELTRAHPYESRPLSWITLKRGVSYWTGEDGEQIYLFGNPLVWAMSSISLFLWMGFQFIRLLLTQRQVKGSLLHAAHPLNSAGGFFFIGWIVNWVPFLFMERQLFIHHYLPALLMGVMLFATMMETMNRLSRKVTVVVVIGLIGATALSFIAYAPWTYGLGKSDVRCRSLQLRESWDWKCPGDTTFSEPVERKDSPQQEKKKKTVENVEETEDVSIPDPVDFVQVENASPAEEHAVEEAVASPAVALPAEEPAAQSPAASPVVPPVEPQPVPLIQQLDKKEDNTSK